MSAEGSRLAVVAAFFVNLAISIAKFVAAGLTGSSAMLSEGFHSVADTGNQLMLLYGMKAARRPATTAHPFGRGKESYFWSFMVAVMLFAGGAVLAIQHGIDALRHPHEIKNLTPSFWVLSISIGLEVVSFTVAVRQFNRVRGSRSVWRSIRDTKDASLVVVLLEDTAALVGLVVALAGTSLAAATGNGLYDGLASLVIGAILAVVAVLLAIETKALLIGEAASRADRGAIRSTLLAMPEVESVGRILTMQLGPNELLVNIEVDLDEGLAAEEIADSVRRAEAAIQVALPAAKHISIELHSDERA